jgi:hypothetical protein
MEGMPMAGFEKLFESDQISKRERIERALNHQPVDRAPLHDQLSYNPGVIELYTGRHIEGFDYTREDVCAVIRRTLDACFIPISPLGTDQYTDVDGLVHQNDNWNTWIASRPFNDIDTARDFMLRKTKRIQTTSFDPVAAGRAYKTEAQSLQALIGDTVHIDISTQDGFCDCWSILGLELFTYLYQDSPRIIADYIETYTQNEVRRIHAVADLSLSPVILIAEDFASKTGPIFSPRFLRTEHFPRVRRITEAWHDHGIKVIYHSDGNWMRVIPDLIETGVDGFYCLEPAAGMDIVELKRQYPQLLWAGGVDGVDLMERAPPDQVVEAVRNMIRDTDVLRTGGAFIGTSSEVNPPVRPENFRAMVETVGTVWNSDFTAAGWR